MDADGRVRFAEQLAELRDQAGLSLAGVATAAHVARGYVHHIEHGHRWPTQPVAKALDDAVDAGGALLGAWEVADALPRAAAVPADPEDRERVALAARHPRRVDAALALGLEIDDPDLTSLVLSFTGHLAWMVDDPHGVIALSRGARRDKRVFVAQHAYNAHQEARGWAMAGEPAEVNRTLRRADKLAERTIARQADVPPNMYWYGSGFFTLQRGLTWHTLGEPRLAERAAKELTNGVRELPDAERHSEWAAIFTVAAEALTTAGEAERAVAQARQALAVCRVTKSTRLARALRRAHTQMRETWPTHPAVRELGDEVRPLSSAR